MPRATLGSTVYTLASWTCSLANRSPLRGVERRPRPPRPLRRCLPLGHLPALIVAVSNLSGAKAPGWLDVDQFQQRRPTPGSTPAEREGEPRHPHSPRSRRPPPQNSPGLRPRFRYLGALTRSGSALNPSAVIVSPRPSHRPLPRRPHLGHNVSIPHNSLKTQSTAGSGCQNPCFPLLP